MDQLPAELVEQIISYIDWNDVKSLRLSCRYLSHFGGQQLFQDVHVFPLDESLENLSSISQHAQHKKHVTTITCYMPIFRKKFSRISQYQEFLDKSPELRYMGKSIYVPGPRTPDIPRTLKTGPSEKYDNAAMSRAMKAYNAYFKQQEELLSSGQLMARMATALNQFIKLRTVTSTSICPTEEEYSCIDDFVTRSKILNTARKETLLPVELTQPKRSAARQYFVQLLRAFSISGSPPPVFRLQGRGFRHDERIFQLKDRDMSHAEKALTNMKGLSLDFKCSGSTFGQTSLSEGSLTRFVQLAANLCSLHLCQGQFKDIVPAIHTFDDVLERLTFPQLRFFSLSHVRVFGSVLRLFLDRHKECLRGLGLCRILLIADYWWELFGEFRTEHQLHEIHLRDLYENQLLSTLSPGPRDMSIFVHGILEEWAMGMTPAETLLERFPLRQQ